MSQHDYNIANGGGATVRADINSALDAVLSQNSGATAPTVTKPYMPWYDTTSGALKFRSADDAAWISGTEAFAGTGGFGFRNRITNGDMRIDQRNAGASVTPTASTYTVDRWQFQCTQASKMAIQQLISVANGPAGFPHYLQAITSSAFAVTTSDFFALRTAIEGLDVQDLAWGTTSAKSATLSFYVYATVAGSYGGAISNNASNRSYPFAFTVTTGGIWQFVSITIPGDTTGTWLKDTGTGLNIYFGLGVGATYSGTAGAWAAGNYVSSTGAISVVGTLSRAFLITAVQFEVGGAATPFERRPMSTELAMCKRYYEKSYELGTVVGSAVANGYTMGSLNSNASTAYYTATTVPFKVSKRSAAIMRYWDVAGTISRTSTYTGGGLTRVDGNSNVSSFTGYENCAVMIVSTGALLIPAWQWEASSEL